LPYYIFHLPLPGSPPAAMANEKCNTANGK
jgi:hypothetical protein